MKKTACIIATTSIVVLISAGNASALELRFVHGVPGAGSATLAVDGTTIGPASFAGVTSYASVRPGRRQVALKPAGGGKALARATESLSGNRVTVLAERRGGRVVLRLLHDSRASGGRARLRAVNAAPELDRAAIELDGRPVFGDVGSGQASGYRSVDPGTYKLEATRPSGAGGALASRAGVTLAAGTSTTAFLVGSGGEPTRIVVAADATVTPRGAPGTGLGGLAGGTAWAAALAAALGAGVLGGAAYTLARRRRHGA